MSSTGGYQRIPPGAPGIDQAGSGDVTFPASINLPNAATTAANYIQLGPATTAGVRITRNGAATVQFANGDSSANATAACAQMRSTNDQGAGAPNFSSSYQPTYGVYIQNTGPFTTLVSAGAVALRCAANGQTNLRSASASRTAASQSIAATDSNAIWDNTGTLVQTTVNLPPASNSLGATYTFINQGFLAAGMRVVASQIADRLAYNGALGTANGNVTSAATYSSITVAAVTAGVWNVIAATGAWTLT